MISMKHCVVSLSQTSFYLNTTGIEHFYVAMHADREFIPNNADINGAGRVLVYPVNLDDLGFVREGKGESVVGQLLKYEIW